MSSHAAGPGCFVVSCTIALSACLLAACGGRQPAASASAAPNAAEEKVLNVYNWSDYVAPDVVPAFEKEYGIKVHYDVFESNDVLETKLLTGRSGYDIVVPTGSYLAREIKAGVLRELDKSALSNFGNIDPEIARQTELFDPGRKYAANYLVATMGVGYDAAKISAALPDAPVDSLRMVFDPNVIRHFAKCGITFVDAPDDVVSTVLLYLGRPPNSESSADLAAAEKVLMAVRPYVRRIEAMEYLDDMANGEICVALGWGGDVAQAKARAREAGKASTFTYRVPKEGALLILDMFAIPKDAPHPRNAGLFINYMLRPEVAARNSSYLHYQTSNSAAYALVDPAVYNDRGIYPSPEAWSKLSALQPRSPAYTRALNRMWTRFKAGR
jgi:putrescine transport system substrate-binding protein